eukprot:TRINITY_DN19109_c0_g1_i2.p1 TRINITY_DN19109_c0_g1~~TRINITY_DN19109_c0_g1_i2.p1  ORF type:complete len:1357 (+),score=219.64 TRINITY_DN19109_c0_g1_i2:35-4072(+)
MLRQSRRLLAKKKKGTRKTTGYSAQTEQFVDISGNVVDLASYEQPRQAHSPVQSSTPRPASKYVNKRRANRLKEFRAQQPQIKGGYQQPWNGYGFFDHHPNPVHDLTHEEIEEYIQGTEYTELPEVKGKNEDWPRLPHDVDLIETQTTGFEHSTPLFKEEPWAKELAEGERHHSYMGDDGYDIDLTKPGALEAYQADIDEYDGDLAHVPIRAAPQFEVINQVKWVDGKWVKSIDPNFKRMPHSAFVADYSETQVGTALLDPDLDLGESGDGGYAAELARFGAMTSSSAGVDPSDVIKEEDIDTINLIEGGVSLKPKVIDVTHTTTTTLTPGDDALLETTTMTTTTSTTTTTAAGTPSTQQLPEGQLQSEPQEADMFADLMSVQGEAIVSSTHTSSEVEGNINGVPIDALNNQQIVDPTAVTVEHENHVFSGLYPRQSDEEMSEFERDRLARCLEMHQKHNVPLSHAGVDPYSNNAFLRRKNPFNTRADDEVGRKHDLSVEFKLRQQLKLGYDADKVSRPMYRSPESISTPVRGLISEPHRRIMNTSMSPNVLKNTDLFPDGFLEGNGWKMYGDTKYTASPLNTRSAGFFNQIAGNSLSAHYGGFCTESKYQAYKAGEELRLKLYREEELQRKRKIKEEEYKKRLSGRVDDAEQQQHRVNDEKLETMRMKDFTEDEKLLSETRNTDIYLEPARVKHQEDILSIYGRNPFKIDVRYLPWRARGEAWRDIPEDQLGLRGTGHHNRAFHQEGIYGFRIHRAQMDFVRWNSFVEPFRKRMWTHFNKKISTDNFLNETFSEAELPKAGGSREAATDLKVYKKQKIPGWAFRPRLDNSGIPAVEGDSFEWNVTSVDSSNTTATSARPAWTKPSVFVRKSDAEKFALSGQRRSYSSSAISRGQRRCYNYQIHKDEEYHSSPIHRFVKKKGFTPGEYAHVEKRSKNMVPDDIMGYHVEQEEEIPEDERLKRRHRYSGRNVATAEWPLNGTAAVVIGIEGVIQKGAHVVSGSQDAVRHLKSRKIPLLFYSDGFPQWTEAEMAANLSQALGISISKEEVMLGCNSCVFHSIEEENKKKHTLVIGPKGSSRILKNAGFENVVGIDRLVQQFSGHFPGHQKAGTGARTGQYIIENIIITGVPSDWGSALQACLDVLLTKEGQGVGSKHSLMDVGDSEQHVKVFVTDPRALISSEHEVPRINSGFFVESLKMMFENCRGGRKLETINVSRLNHDVQRLIEERVLSLSKNYYKYTAEMTHIYNVTDHIHHDAVAVNTYRDSYHLRWWSVIVSTGICSDANTSLGHYSKHDLHDKHLLENLKMADRNELLAHLDDRTCDVGYVSLQMFVADLLGLEYHHHS